MRKAASRSHPRQFGAGEVVQTEGTKVSVRFGRAGIRTIEAGYLRTA